MNPTAHQLEESTERPQLWTRDPMIISDPSTGETTVLDYGLVEFEDHKLSEVRHGEEN